MKGEHEKHEPSNLPPGLKPLSTWRTHPLDENQKERTWNEIQARLNTNKMRFQTRKRKRWSEMTFGGMTAASVVIMASIFVFQARHASKPAESGISTVTSHNQVQPTPPAVLTGRLTKIPATFALPPGNHTNMESPFSGVSPDGQWLAVRQADGLMLWNTNGTQVDLKYGPDDTYHPDSICGETTNGDLLLGGSAGGGGVFEVYRPGYGVLKRLYGLNQYTERATVSQKGHLLSQMSNFSGGGPSKKNWTTIDGQTIPALTGMVEGVWSPDGVTLAAALNGSSPTDSFQKSNIVLYNTQTGQLQALSGLNFQPEASDSPAAPIREEAEHLGWSPDGHYLGVYSDNQLDVYDQKTGKIARFATSKSSMNWAFLSNDTLMILQSGGTNLDFYRDQVGQWVLTDERQIPNPITAYKPLGNSQLLVSNALGEIDLMTPTQSVTIVSPRPVNHGTTNWWYNFSEHNLYYVDGTGLDESKVYVVSVPQATRGDAS